MFAKHHLLHIKIANDSGTCEFIGRIMDVFGNKVDPFDFDYLVKVEKIIQDTFYFAKVGETLAIEEFEIIPSPDPSTLLLDII